MSPYQRRAFAACIFALAFIFFYEARGERLISVGDNEQQPANASLKEHYWESIGAGVFVVALGAILLFTLRRSDRIVRFSSTELCLFALGVGVLLGTAIVSWVRI